MPAGPIPDNPAELLSSPNLAPTLRQLATYFDWIILDSPPVMALADATLLAPYCDATIMVIRNGKTPSKIVRESVSRLGKHRVCGVVLNRCPSAGPALRYYNRYYQRNS
jgi:Mrp family chromosome partitioning ATPase